VIRRAPPVAEFDLTALYAALDAERQARGLNWQQLAREISRVFSDSIATPISPSTLTGMRSRAQIEGDGVLQMLLWLKRTPESFIPGHKESRVVSLTLPRVGRDRILRFDAVAIHAALDARRVERGLTWAEVAAEIGGFSPAGLTRMAKGGRVGFPSVMRIARWLECPAASLTHASDR
jgi:transcriptional regulator with XRE-family HTH domain